MPTYADPDLVAKLSRDTSLYVDDDTAIAALHPFSEEVEILTGNINESGAAAVAGRMKPMGAPGRGGWQLTVPELNHDLTVGITIEIQAPGSWDGYLPFFIRGEKVDGDKGEAVYSLIGGPS